MFAFITKQYARQPSRIIVQVSIKFHANPDSRPSTARGTAINRNSIQHCAVILCDFCTCAIYQQRTEVYLVILFHHYTLRTALLLFVLLPFVLLMVIGGLYSLSQLEDQVETRMQDEIAIIARAIRLPLSHALQRGRLDNMEQALVSALRFDRVYGVYVYNENGERIISSGTHKARVETDRAAELASSGNRQGDFEQAGGEEIFSYFLPLIDRGGRINGLLQVTRRGSDFRDYIAQLRIGALSVLGITTLILVLIVFFGHNRAIGRYLHSLEQSMASIGAGETDQHVPEAGPVELSRLSRSINGMLNRIRRSQQEIAEQREREMDLRLRLEHSEKLAAIGRLASGVAHELGTPLSTVDGQAQRLLRDERMDSATRKSVQQIRDEVARMEHIIHQMMDYGRRNPLQKRTLSSDRIAYSVHDQLSRNQAEAKANITLSGPEPGPEVTVDIIRIEQALTNLLRNALKAARNHVRLTWHAEAGWCVLSVEDDGAGVDTSIENNLFEPFYTTNPVGQGTGLGLAVAHAAVSDHDGHITVDQSPEKGGARFRIYLPGDHT